MQLLAQLLCAENVATLAFQTDAFLNEVYYPYPRIWTFLQGLFAGLEPIFYSQLWLPRQSRNSWTTDSR